MSSREPPPGGFLLSGDLLAAYRRAVYRVESDPPIELRVDEASEPLRALHASLRVGSSAIVTACNPFSRALSARENARRHDALRRQLDAAGWRVLPAVGLDPDGVWPDEPGLWVADIDAGRALQLGERWQQHAVLWCDADAIPRLLLHRRPAPFV